MSCLTHRTYAQCKFTVLIIKVGVENKIYKGNHSTCTIPGWKWRLPSTGEELQSHSSHLPLPACPQDRTGRGRATLVSFLLGFPGAPVVQFSSVKCRPGGSPWNVCVEIVHSAGWGAPWCFWSPKEVVHLNLKGLELLLKGTWLPAS